MSQHYIDTFTSSILNKPACSAWWHIGTYSSFFISSRLIQCFWIESYQLMTFKWRFFFFSIMYLLAYSFMADLEKTAACNWETLSFRESYIKQEKNPKNPLWLCNNTWNMIAYPIAWSLVFMFLHWLKCFNFALCLSYNYAFNAAIFRKRIF